MIFSRFNFVQLGIQLKYFPQQLYRSGFARLLDLLGLLDQTRIMHYLLAKLDGLLCWLCLVLIAVLFQVSLPSFVNLLLLL